MYKKILIPTDGSEYSKKEAEKVPQLLQEGGEVIIVAVGKQIKRTTFQWSKHVQDLNDEFLKEAQENANEMKKLFDENINIKTIAVNGFPAETINEIAEKENVELILISSSGKSGLKKLMLGSVAEKLVAITQKDILIIKS
ncbi:MAG: universal stress protein [Methanosphaera stadtmanae]|nr:universal stress protein [Methanosphaera stadtmanae]